MTTSISRAELRWLATVLLLAVSACLTVSARSESASSDPATSDPASSDAALTPHEATYSVKISVVGGKLRTRLVTTDEGYAATHVIEPTGMSRLLARGSIAETSEFTSGPDGVVPIAYRSNDTLSRDKSRAEVRFDWEDNKAAGLVDGKAVLTDLEGLSHDRVSIQYQLMHDLLNDTPSTQYRMFEVDKLRNVNIRNVGTRRVAVRAGEFEAIGIQHQAENSSRVTTLWFAAELDYLPVIIEQHRKGKLRVRATLDSYSPIVDAPAEE